MDHPKWSHEGFYVGNVAEDSSGDFFMVRQGRLITPFERNAVSGSSCTVVAEVEQTLRHLSVEAR